MKTNRRPGLMVIGFLLSCCVYGAAYAEESGLGLKGIPADKDTQVVIRHGDPGSLDPEDVKVVEGTEEIIGDESASVADSLASWKKACAEWKKELKELNPGRVLSANCGTPKLTQDPKNFSKSQTSTAAYKLTLQVRNRK
ncbi:MAG: hypothetical protein H7222_18240 [Methylotenera sp.]|nr:hypothetical protein [Oligoflexia bacterium]